MRFAGTYREDAWRRCAAAAAGDGLVYAMWKGDHYPGWSLPALEAAACARRQGDQAFERVHLRLYEAFFTHGRDIADPAEVARIVAEAGIDQERFLADYRAGAGRQSVVDDYRAAVAAGIASIPTVIFPQSGRALVGLAGAEQYRAAFEDAARC